MYIKDLCHIYLIIDTYETDLSTPSYATIEGDSMATILSFLSFWLVFLTGQQQF